MNILERPKPRRAVMLAGSLVILLFLGLNYGWSIFVRPLELEYGWKRADTAIVFTVSIISFTFGSILGGLMMRRFQARTVVQTASFLFLIGFVLSARITSLPQLIFSYGVLCGFGVGIAYNTVIATILPWFPEKRGTVSGLMSLAYGSGTFILGSLTSMLLSSTIGWRTTMTILGIGFFTIIFLGAFLIVPPPAWQPAASAKTDQSETTSPQPPAAERSALTPREMVRQPVFWFFYLWIVLHGGSGMAIFAHAAPGASDLGASVMTAAVLLGLLSIGSACGRFMTGFSFDHKGLAFTMWSISACFLAGAVVLQIAFRTRSTTLLGVAYLLCGIAFGGVASLVPVFTGSVFGQRTFYLNFGVALSYSIFSVSLGSSVGGYLRDKTGSYALTYRMIFLYVGIGMVIALFLFRALKSDRYRQRHQQPD